MTEVSATSKDGSVILVATRGNDLVSVRMSTRAAFALVTDLLSAIDAARAQGEFERKEVGDPKTEARKKYERRRVEEKGGHRRWIT